MVDPAQQKRIEEAARKFAEAVRESFDSASSRSAEAQERSRQITESFFESVNKELQTQVESNKEVSQRLVEQTRNQQEALQQLTQESMNSYKEFLGSMTAYYQSAMEQARRNAGR